MGPISNLLHADTAKQYLLCGLLALDSHHISGNVTGRRRGTKQRPCSVRESESSVLCYLGNNAAGQSYCLIFCRAAPGRVSRVAGWLDPFLTWLELPAQKTTSAQSATAVAHTSLYGVLMESCGGEGMTPFSSASLDESVWQWANFPSPPTLR